jgi:hypothetical protein
MDRTEPPVPADVLAVVVVYVPHLRGYFTNRLAVVKLSLESLARHKPPETKVLVFDNGSCEEVRVLLAGMLERGEIDFVLRSRVNIGTPAAVRTAFSLAVRPLIAYGDDDVYYYPGWLEAQLRVLASFPGAGMVSGVPTLDGADHALDATLLAARRDPSIRIDETARIPGEWEEDWAGSTGRDPQERRGLAASTPVPRLERDGAQAFVGATHFQYVGLATHLALSAPREWPDSLMGNMRELDHAMDERGLMRLSTTQRYVRHVGNAVGQALRREATAAGFDVLPPVRPPRVTRLEAALERNRSLHGKIWVTYRHIGRFLDGERILSDALVQARRQEEEGQAGPGAVAR